MDKTAIVSGKTKCRTLASQTCQALQQAIKEINSCITEARALKGVDSQKTVTALESIRSDMQKKITALGSIK